MSKTTSELNFEKYLSQEKINWEYEPCLNGSTKPDYKFTINGKRVLTEVKELNNLTDIVNGTAEFYNVNSNELHRRIRKKIMEACKQIKPYKDSFDFLIVIVSDTSSYQVINHRSLFCAMYGDDYITFPINPRTGGGDINRLNVQHRVNGQVRYNDQFTKEMKTRHAYLSGVGLLFGELENGAQNIKLKVISNELGAKKLDQNSLVGIRAIVDIPRVIYRDA